MNANIPPFNTASSAPLAAASAATSSITGRRLMYGVTSMPSSTSDVMSRAKAGRSSIAAQSDTSVSLPLRPVRARSESCSAMRCKVDPKRSSFDSK